MSVYDGRGNPLAQEPVAGGAGNMLAVEAEGIRRIIVDAPNHEVMLHGVCVKRLGGDARIDVDA